MNFKFKKIKVIGSIIIPLIIWIVVLILGSVRMLSNVPTIIRSFLEIHNLGNILSLGNISLFIIEVIIVYIIWSLFQKKITPN